MEKKSIISIKDTLLKFIVADYKTTLLDAALNSNISLPHGCKSGACGSCKAELIEGNVKTKSSEASTTEKTILLCQSYACSKKMIIAYPTNKLNIIQTQNKKEKSFIPKEFSLQVVGNKSVTPLVKELSFFVPPKLNLKFQPGAYMEIYDNKKKKKKYSIVNAPAKFNNLNKNIIKFLITKNERKGLSQFIHDIVKVGDILKLKGPYLSFQYNINSNKPILAIAGGSGISPILSIVKSALFKYKNLNVMIFQSVRNRQEILEMNSLYNLKERYKNVSFKITLTREELNQNSQFLFGRVNTSLQKVFKDLSTHQLLIAGADAFVDASYEHAIKLNANENNIFFEKFSSN